MTAAPRPPKSWTPEDARALDQLRAELDALIKTVSREATQTMRRWRPWLARPEVEPDVHNLAAYLALRRRDLRALQTELLTWGVSSLGRAEPHVLANLRATSGALAALAGEVRPFDRAPLTASSAALQARSQTVFGPTQDERPAIVVTFPSEAPTDPGLVRALLEAGMNVARINLAHDDEAAWTAMLDHLRAAERELGRECRVLMDLGGPKVRTERVQGLGKKGRLRVGDQLTLLVGDAAPDGPRFGCTLPEAVRQVEVGHGVWVDDGKLGTVVERVDDAGLHLRVTHARSKGERLREGKGLNFPDTALTLPALTDKDGRDLAFAARHADLIGYSFVQTVADVEALLAELERLEARPDLGLVLKIETRTAVEKLPDLLVRTVGTRPGAVMIARGDLAVELGFGRLAEVQAQLLWLCEAAHTPVIWATQVLEQLVKKGTPSRGEFTDAAMAVRAEAVMLNKGPHVVQGVQSLIGLFARMRGHQLKKRPQLRALSLAGNK